MKEEINIYYSNITKSNGKLYTTGGRVMSIVYMDDDLIKCYNMVYNNMSIEYDNLYYRKENFYNSAY